MRGVAWEGDADLARFVQDAPLGVAPNVSLGADVFATQDIRANEELFANYGAAYWGKRLREAVKCVACLEDECYISKLVQCELCRNHTHRCCLSKIVEECLAAAADDQLRAPHNRMLTILPRCPMCRAPWPLALTGQKQCTTPGCTLPDNHTSAHSTELDLYRRRSV
jgi:hypothetical protein